MKLNVHVIIFFTSLILYFASVIFFSVKIRKLKKQCSEIPPVSKSYRASHVFSLLVVLLPLGIPFEPFVMAVLCGCGILGELIVLKDRVSVLKEKINSQK